MPILNHHRTPSEYFTLVTFDASLSGGGATLQAGLRSLKDAATGPVVSYWYSTWSDEDLAIVHCKKGEPSGQAILEAYALLISITTWVKILAQAQGALHIRGDALGVLHSMLRFKAKDAVLNAIAGELAYLIAPLGLDLRAAHIWSEKNEICDHLSRLLPGQQPNKTELAEATPAKRQPVPRFLLNSLVKGPDAEPANAVQIFRNNGTKGKRENSPCQLTSGGQGREITETAIGSTAKARPPCVGVEKHFTEKINRAVTSE